MPTPRFPRTSTAPERARHSQASSWISAVIESGWQTISAGPYGPTENLIRRVQLRFGDKVRGEATVVQGKRRVITSIDEFLDPNSLRRHDADGADARRDACRDRRDRLGRCRCRNRRLLRSGRDAWRNRSRTCRAMVPLRRMMSGHVNGETLAPDRLLVFGESSEVAGFSSRAVALRRLVDRAAASATRPQKGWASSSTFRDAASSVRSDRCNG